MRKIWLIVIILIVVTIAFVGGYHIGKNHVIYTQEIYVEGGEYIAVIDGNAHSYS